MAASDSAKISSRGKQPMASGLHDLTIIEAFDPKPTPRTAAKYLYVTFYLVTPKDEIYFGQLFKQKKDISLEQYNAALEYVPDDEIYPMVPPEPVPPEAVTKASPEVPPKGVPKESSKLPKESSEVPSKTTPEVATKTSPDAATKASPELATKTSPDAPPKVPPKPALTIAPDDLDESKIFIKRPGLICYEVMRGTDWIPNSVLEETLNMEKISKMPHPYIVRYLGCRVRRGRITAIVLERLEHTLMQYVREPGFATLDKAKLVWGVESAVKYLHSLKLAHNDISPYNIMVRSDGTPVLIDFGSCQPFEKRLRSLGTSGWYDEKIDKSDAKQDIFGLKKLREWLEKPE